MKKSLFFTIAFLVTLLVSSFNFSVENQKVPFKTRIIGTWKMDSDFAYALFLSEKSKTDRDKYRTQKALLKQALAKASIRFTATDRFEVNDPKNGLRKGTYTINEDVVIAKVNGDTRVYTLLDINSTSTVLYLKIKGKVLRLTR